jgi:acetolactate synthase-1/2/3 large subunit
MSDGFASLCEALREVDVECVFGVPGTQNVALFEAFRAQGIRTVLTSHELAASFAVNGYYRASGRVAALATIPGPGFTYALTGVAEARLDSVAVLYLVGRPATQPGRRFHLQAIDQRHIAEPLVKATLELASPSECASVVRSAYELATSGEPGPVMIELDLRALAGDDGPARRAEPSAPAAAPHELQQLQRVFMQAAQPVFLLGSGAIGAADRIRRVAESAVIPIVTTPSARGIVPEDDRLVLGFDSLRGHTPTLNAFLGKADLIVGLGCKLGHNGSAGFELRLPPERFVHVDAAPHVVNANYDAALSIVADVNAAVATLEVPRGPTEWTIEEIASCRTAVRAATGDAEPKIAAATSMRPAEAFAWLRAALPRETIVVTDSGLHQILTRRYYDVLSPRGLICPSDFQSMGYGLPAAIGAKLAAPDRPVVAIVGDGGFLMSGMDMLTARREQLPILVIVFNDGHLNQIRLHQWSDYGRAHAVDLLNPDYAALAGAFGIGYLRFGDCDEADIAHALRGPGPTLLEVVVRDSADMYRLPVIARAKAAVRRGMPRGIREWLRARFHA